MASKALLGVAGDGFAERGRERARVAAARRVVGHAELDFFVGHALGLEAVLRDRRVAEGVVDVPPVPGSARQRRRGPASGSPMASVEVVRRRRGAVGQRQSHSTATSRCRVLRFSAFTCPTEDTADTSRHTMTITRVLVPCALRSHVDVAVHVARRHRSTAWRKPHAAADLKPSGAALSSTVRSGSALGDQLRRASGYRRTSPPAEHDQRW